MKIQSLVCAIAALSISLVASTAEARPKARKSSGESPVSERSANFISGVAGAVSGFSRSAKTARIAGNISTVVPIGFAFVNVLEVSSRCATITSKRQAAWCQHHTAAAGERLGEAVISASPVGDVKEVFEGAAEGNLKRISCGIVGGASWLTPAAGFKFAGGACGLFDAFEAATGEDLFAPGRSVVTTRSTFDVRSAFRSDGGI